MSIRFEAISKKFGTKVILKDFSFEVAKGEILFILGKSGTGKSVSLKLMVGLLKPDRGKLWIDGTEVSSLTETELGPIRKKCGMIFQQPALFDSMTVEQNVGYGLPTDLAATVRRSRIQDVLARVHLGENLLERYPHSLSYGTQKRISIARTLAPTPDILLFDEPTTGLDPINTRAINHLISDLSRTLHTTSVVVSHDMESALSVADRILVLDQGRAIALGTPNEMANSKEPLILEFLQDVRENRRVP